MNLHSNHWQIKSSCIWIHYLSFLTLNLIHKIGKYTKDETSLCMKGFFLLVLHRGFVTTHFLMPSGFMGGGLTLSISHTAPFSSHSLNIVLYTIISRFITKLKYFHVTFFPTRKFKGYKAECIQTLFKISCLKNCTLNNLDLRFIFIKQFFKQICVFIA